MYFRGKLIIFQEKYQYTIINYYNIWLLLLLLRRRNMFQILYKMILHRIFEII